MPVTKLGKSSRSNGSGRCCFAGTNLRVFPILLGLVMVTVPVSAYGKAVAEWDFSKGTQGWTGNSRVE